MSFNTKNYTEQGGERTVIGGELIIEDGAQVTGLPLNSSSGKMVALDFQGFNLFDALPGETDITHVITPSQLREACEADFVSLKNLRVGRDGDTINYHGIYASSSCIMAGIFHLPGNEGEIDYLFSFAIALKQNEGEVETVILIASSNDNVNGKLDLHM